MVLPSAENVPLKRWEKRNGAAIDTPLEELLLCPKPHITPWRVDLVRLNRDCCQSAALCHIKGQAGAQKPRRLVELQDVTDTIKSARGSRDATDSPSMAESAEISTGKAGSRAGAIPPFPGSATGR